MPFQNSCRHADLTGLVRFGAPELAQISAAEDLPLCVASTAAYGSPNSTKADEIAKFKAGKAGLGDEWCLWTDFPDGRLQTEMDSVHLRAQVWEKQSDHLIVVTFGGTVATSIRH